MQQTMRRVLVTRPLHDAQPWVDALRTHGLQARALPLMAIGPCRSHEARQALAAARTAVLTPGRYRAVMFVSGNAAQHFFQSDPVQSASHQALLAPDTRAWTPGPGTARTLQALGVPDGQIDGPLPDAAQFESETLWQQVRGQIRPGDRVLIVRGDTATALPAHANARAEIQTASTAGAGRDWLAARLRGAGAQVELLAVYERQLPQWTAEEQALARSAAFDGTLWLFSSSEAVANLQQLLPDQDWHAGRALATHERIASKALQAGFGVVLRSRPALDEVLASIESAP